MSEGIKAKSLIHIVDTYFCNKPQFCSNFIIKHGSKATFIDCNTVLAVPRLLKGLSDIGVSPNDVENVIPTHAHLDHCGGVFEILKHCPNAQVFAHEKTVNQLKNPEKLIKGTIDVYGEENFKSRYGYMEAVDPQRMHVVKHGEVLKLENDAEIQLYHAPGHASHHIVAFETSNRAIFTGDAFGVCIGQGDIRGYIAPTASPVDFNPQEMMKTIDLIENLKPKAAYLAHYGCLNDVDDACEQLRHGVEVFGKIYEETKQKLKTKCVHDDQIAMEVENSLMAFVLAKAESLGYSKSPEKMARFMEIVGVEMRLNVQGIIVAADRASRWEQKQLNLTHTHRCRCDEKF